MPFLIGTDEAGYGPNLGPLTVTGTLWQTDRVDVELYQTLSEIVSNDLATFSRYRQQPDTRVFVADSKQIYSSSGSIGNLETSVLALIYSWADQVPTNWTELVNLICPSNASRQIANQTWLTSRKLPLPLKSNVDEIRRIGERFRNVSRAAEVDLKSVQCVPVFPPEFNSQIEQLGNKATLLSSETLSIVRRLMDQADDDLEIGCDKHGGRSKYAALIQEYVTREFVMVGNESLQVSDYSFRESDRDVTIRFQAKGETFLPTALASMVSKYVREVFMTIWNEFWRDKIPNLKPTKGYPVDAKRFKSEISQVQKELGIDDRAIWRNK